MENDFVSGVTLQCLMNRDQYAKYIERQGLPTKSLSFKKDKKFYRRRIYDITKSLLNNDPPDALLKDVQDSFDSYVSSCIHYFKTLDKTDLIQEDYATISESINMMNEIEEPDVNQANTLMMRSIKFNYENGKDGTLESFVKINKTEPEIAEIIPQQKEFHLKDPIFKKKGIRKKKNITNKYDETNEKIQQ